MSSSESAAASDVQIHSWETDEELQNALKRSAEIKSDGNAFFVSKNWTSAVTAYNQALAALPPAPERPETRENVNEPPNGQSDGEVDQDHQRTQDRSPIEDGSISTDTVEMTPLQKECSNARVILYSNIAACQLKLEAWEEAVKAATSALNEDQHNQKALWRRAKANEAIDTWSSLTSAQKDYQLLKDIVPPSQPLYRDATSALHGFEPRIEAARKRDVDKMMGQLKTVGDSVLGWFGLSTNNFKMTPNGEGGYSMNFVNNP